ncbi:acyltransferase family protein [Janibacter sp. GS2]|uniref:acyltransferase family protein n=1 Tax=Janibacter sp. GS2 TaxID=3442646 RepID=UPI003EC063DB
MRNGYLDLLRVVGTIAIVLGHIEALAPIPALVYPWHVPIFFILSGWLWRTGRSVRSEIRVRAKSLLLPYATWFVVVSVVYGAVLAAHGRDQTEKVEEQLPGGAHAVEPYSAFWFITALFVAVVLIRALEATGLPLWAQVAVGVLACVLVQVFPDIAIESPFAIAQGIGCMVFVHAGRLLRRVGSHGGWAAGALLAGVALAALPWVRDLDLKFIDYGTPVAGLVAAVLISAGLVMAPIHIGGVWAHRLGALAQTGFAVVLLHALIVWLGRDDPPLVVAAIAVVLPWVIGLLLARTRAGAAFGCARPAPLVTAPAPAAAASR